MSRERRTTQRGRPAIALALAPSPLHRNATPHPPCCRLHLPTHHSGPLKTRTGPARTLVQHALVGVTSPQQAMQAVHSAFAGTGVYKHVDVAMTPSKIQGDAAGTRTRFTSTGPCIEHDVDVRVGLGESSYHLNAGVEVSPSGSGEAYTEAGLHNLFGGMDTLTARVVGVQTSSSDLARNVDTAAHAAQRIASQVHTADPSALTSLLAAPSFSVTYSKPTVGTSPTPLALSLRRQVLDRRATASHSCRVVEAAAALSSASGATTGAYSLAWRNLIPVTDIGSYYGTAASPPVVKDAGSSLAASVRLSHKRDTRNDEVTSGSLASGSVELAHPVFGGDVGFVRTGLQWDAATSWRRFMPDHGWAALTSRPAAAARRTSAAAVAQQAMGSSGSSDSGAGPSCPAGIKPAEAAAARAAGLQPHPGASGVLPKWLASMAGSPGSPAARRLAAWLGSGVTVACSGELGYIMPLYVGGGVQPATSIVDRYTAGAPLLRGFVDCGLGPHVHCTSANVPPGTPRLDTAAGHADAVGGDVLAAATVRALLPPPLPSATLTNAGVRTFLWASAGALLSARGASQMLAGSTAAVKQHAAATAGVGLRVPLGGLAVEINALLGTTAAEAQVGAITEKFGLKLVTRA